MDKLEEIQKILRANSNLMADSGAIRLVMELGAYECRVPCEASKKCVYRKRRVGLPFRLRTR